MKLWDYLKEKLIAHGNKLAFANSGIRYSDLLYICEMPLCDESFSFCEGKTRERQAIEIIRAVAKGKTAVPITSAYGMKNYNYIKELIQSSDLSELDDVRFLMFTSGTTGTPKGVMLTDDNVISNLEYIKTYFDLAGIKTICIARPLVHIAVLTGELLYALCNGLTIYFYEESFMPQRLLSYFVRNEIDVFCGTPTLYQALAYATKGEAFPIKIGVISGERLTKKQAEAISVAFPDTEFYNVYGLTEHSPRVSALLPKDFSSKAGSVGKPIGDVKVRIANGELLVKSPSVMKGYFLNEKLTATKIVDGWLYTGDKVSVDSDGYLYIDGRMDDMLIRAGINVYPEEIEDMANRIMGVEDSLVYGENTDSGTILCMKYVGTIDSKELRKQLLAVINPNVIPSKIEKVEEIARTASGKKVRI